MSETLQISKRHLPHWTIDGAVYFVTFRSYVLFTLIERKMILDHITLGSEVFYTVIAAVIMPDHVHILIHPKSGYALDRIMKGIKGVSARIINKHRGTRGQVWQHESYDRIIRNGKELREKFDYLANNPVRKGLINNPHDYVGWYCNEEIIV